ncbi:MAG: ABC transporter substrate-binding protein [Bacteroidales bacterium]|nr:ABC transporter substrate-binding protein [Bacteroidales bacterium]
MKRLLIVLSALALFCTSLSALDREHTLKVYNWADYIDEDLIGEFEKWYEEQTGEPVKIVYQLFDINEIMLSKIELGHEDFDVVCPSEYIIERMLRADLLLPIDRDFGDTPDYISNISPYIIHKFNQIDGSGKNANDYSVGYMWGTVGMLYNKRHVTPEEASSWYTLKDPRWAGKLFVKDAFRDIYTSLIVALNRDKIDAGELDTEKLCFDSSDESIAMVESFLNEFKDNVSGWEADFGKERMTQEKAWINVTWSGDAQWAIEEAEAVGVPLDFAVPKEGSIVWFDGWVIPKYARNVKAARYFINFMCMPENALRNMDEIGYVSCVGGPEILEAMEDEEAFEQEDASYFFGEEATAACLNPVMYPSADIISRCGMMHDSGERTDNLLQMWSRVKGDSAGAGTYIIIGIVLLAAGAWLFVSKNRKRGRGRKRR